MFCISFAIFFSGTKNKSTRIYGEIINPINDTIRIYNSDTLFTIVLDKENKFDYKFDWPSKKSSDYFNFFHGLELTKMYINKGDNIGLSLILSFLMSQFHILTVMKVVSLHGNT